MRKGKKRERQLLTVDLLAHASMKNAASCDKYCELQNSVNHRIFERKWRSWLFPGACLSECRISSSAGPRLAALRCHGPSAAVSLERQRDSLRLPGISRGT